MHRFSIISLKGINPLFCHNVAFRLHSCDLITRRLQVSCKTFFFISPSSAESVFSGFVQILAVLVEELIFSGLVQILAVLA